MVSGKADAAKYFSPNHHHLHLQQLVPAIPAAFISLLVLVLCLYYYRQSGKELPSGVKIHRAQSEATSTLSDDMLESFRLSKVQEMIKQRKSFRARSREGYDANDQEEAGEEEEEEDGGSSREETMAPFRPRSSMVISTGVPRKYVPVADAGLRRMFGPSGRQRWINKQRAAGRSC
ncbi:uncharacterized protein LOC106013111 [Aplysia californica]|uniref:Uncharacterized protein LOC106013111 n=1 Tax=Aplysia californica TaxID=6500 RepID=A0ABM1A9I0_APLCA|nr:uncharacterized protein LOC106013111 [Aplysia californica]